MRMRGTATPLCGEKGQTSCPILKTRAGRRGKKARLSGEETPKENELRQETRVHQTLNGADGGYVQRIRAPSKRWSKAVLGGEFVSKSGGHTQGLPAVQSVKGTSSSQGAIPKPVPEEKKARRAAAGRARSERVLETGGGLRCEEPRANRGPWKKSL